MSPQSTPPAVPPVLVFAFGDPSRGDDALGPEFARRLEARCFALVDAKRLELLTDFQLRLEHTLDLVARKRVFFVDASAPGSAPYSVAKVHPPREASYRGDQLSPAVLLRTWDEAARGPRPECWVVAIAGAEFQLGAPLSDAAEANLSEALAAVEKMIAPT
jgi:hydrogenase maturation protease